MTVVAIAARRGENAEQGLRGAPGLCDRLGADRECQFDHAPGAAPLGAWQRTGCGQYRAGRFVAARAGENRGRREPIIEPGAEHADAFDGGREPCHADAPRPNSSAQLTPPKPKELLSAVTGDARRERVR